MTSKKVKRSPPLHNSGCHKVTLLGRSNFVTRSEEHTSELQSLAYLVCRLLLEKKKINVSSLSGTPTRQKPCASPKDGHRVYTRSCDASVRPIVGGAASHVLLMVHTFCATCRD